jgi:hypothetical protein
MMEERRVETLALIPAFSPGRRRIVLRLIKIRATEFAGRSS